jgi:two-component system sensor histidine kinase AgrC
MDFMPLIPFLGVSIPESIVLYYMALALLGQRESPLFLAAISVPTSLFSYTVRSLPLPFGIHTFFQVILMVIFLNLIFRIQWIVAVIIMILTSVILGLTEGISVPILAQLFNLNLGDIISDPLLRIVFTLPHLGLLAGLTFISVRHGWRLPLHRRMVKNVSELKGHTFTGRNYLLIVLCLVQALMLVLLNINFYIYTANVYPSFTLNTLVLISSIVIIASALATIFVAGYLLKLTEREARLEIELRHVKEMQNLNLKMQVERHDFCNHLTAVYGYLKAEQHKQAEGYIETLYDNVRQINELMVLNPPELGALLSIKKEEAKTQGIDFNWQVNVESAILPLSPEDLTQLIGNLLDNALEAATSSQSPKVDLIIASNKLGMQLRVSNTGRPIPEEIQHSLFAAGYTTKDVNRHSGLGLFIIKQIVERHGGRLDLKKPENYPGVQFVIYIPWSD